ncbi:MAG TPA: extracellular solute-binding protein [Thermomicrobiales bacterium]|nr:extracellular solute-binding protein [Thermomicrobiales bacterium]
MELDRDSVVPLTQQIIEQVRSQIERGELAPGDRLPTESELCARLGVSRKPVRNALGQLQKMGVLVRRPRRGTFVSPAAERRIAVAPAPIAVVVPEGRWLDPLQRAAARRNAAEPRRPVALAPTMVDLARLRRDLIQAVARGAAPDISLVDSVWVAEFAERDYIHPLDAIDPRLAAALASDLFPALRQQNSVGGRLYALPMEADVAGLWLRRDWFAAEELPPPATWAEWVACARHFQRPAVRARYGLGAYPLAFVGGLRGGETTTYQLTPLLWSTGADVFADGAVALESAAARRAVAFVRDLVRVERVASPEVVDFSWDGAVQAMAAGSAAMALGGSYEGRLIPDAAGWDATTAAAKLAFVPIPAGLGGAPASLVGGMSYVVYRQSRRPETAADLLARTMAPAEVARFCVETGQNPPTRSAAAALAETDAHFLRLTAPLLPAARARWPLPHYAQVSAQLARMFEDAITGACAPAEAVARAAAVIAGLTGLPEAPEPDGRRPLRARGA